jgi:hypothetical protein
MLFSLSLSLRIRYNKKVREGVDEFIGIYDTTSHSPQDRPT